MSSQLTTNKDKKMFKKKMSVKRDQSAGNRYLSTITVEISTDNGTMYNEAVKIISETCCESQEHCIDGCAPYRINCTPSGLLEGDPTETVLALLEELAERENSSSDDGCNTTEKDFEDCLPEIKKALKAGRNIECRVYNFPDQEERFVRTITNYLSGAYLDIEHGSWWNFAEPND